MSFDGQFLVRLVLAVLACYRLSRLIARDDGPFFIFERARQWVHDRAALERNNLGKWNSLSEGLACPYCLGVWFSLPLLALVLWPVWWGDVFLVLMTISGGQAWLWGVANK